eukprot:SAG31_NODE_31_length_32474_cov_18.308139_8_plen_175_part_00
MLCLTTCTLAARADCCHLQLESRQADLHTALHGHDTHARGRLRLRSEFKSVGENSLSTADELGRGTNQIQKGVKMDSAVIATTEAVTHGDGLVTRADVDVTTMEAEASGVNTNLNTRTGGFSRASVSALAADGRFAATVMTDQARDAAVGKINESLATAGTGLALTEARMGMVR